MTISNIDLNYLSNRNYFNEINKIPTSNKIKKKDIKFYKKRFINFTKNLLKGENLSNSENISKIFQEYLISVIEHFKTIDKEEILQETYIDNDVTKTEHLETIYEDEDEEIFYDIDEVNNMLFNSNTSKNITMNTLDDYIIKIDTSNDNEDCKKYIPTKKIINLENPKFKKKGLKNNIN